MAMAMSQINDPASRPVSSLSLSHAIKTALNDAGYRHLADLTDISSDDLCTELNIARGQAEEILRAIGSTDRPGPSWRHAGSTTIDQVDASQPRSSTVSALLHADDITRFSTFSKSLDELIELVDFNHHKRPSKGKEKAEPYGAVVPGLCLEVSGPPGSGKTAIAMALGMSCRSRQTQIQRVSSSRDGTRVAAGEVLIVDTEGAMSIERFKGVAEALTRNSDENTSDLLDGIHLLRIATQAQMIAFLNTMDQWLLDHPTVNLIIIDTLSFHFRHPSMDIKVRSRLMDLIKQQIGKATTVHNCAVVVTSQLATKLLTAENKPANFDTGDRAVLMPQLGDLWATGRVIRLVLFRGQGGDEMRYAHASSTGGATDPSWARYDVDHDGLPCDV